ncbi:MAG TPA: DUF3800 domain-containing protein [Bacilli bacterium]|nr:DUF3800 domain-containing protein [Bacilli bacterium]
MYFVFIDEAGTPGFHKGKTPEGYFTLAGLVVKIEHILSLERELHQIKAEFDLHPHDEVKWGAKYSRFGFTFEQFSQYRKSVFGLIQHRGETVIASVLDKEESYKKEYINDHFELYQQALFLLMERIHKWLNDLGVEAGTVIFVIDSRKNNKEANLDEKLAEAYVRALRTGTFFTGFVHFSETPFFATSEGSVGLQLADFCAGPIQQYFSTGKDEWYLFVREKIRKSPYDGRIAGFGIKAFPQRATDPFIKRKGAEGARCPAHPMGMLPQPVRSICTFIVHHTVALCKLEICLWRQVTILSTPTGVCLC